MKEIMIHPGFKVAMARLLFYLAAWIVAERQKINRRNKLKNASNEFLKRRYLC